MRLSAVTETEPGSTHPHTALCPSRSPSSDRVLMSPGGSRSTTRYAEAPTCFYITSLALRWLQPRCSRSPPRNNAPTRHQGAPRASRSMVPRQLRHGPSPLFLPQGLPKVHLDAMRSRAVPRSSARSVLG